MNNKLILCQHLLQHKLLHSCPLSLCHDVDCDEKILNNSINIHLETVNWTTIELLIELKTSLLFIVSYRACMLKMRIQ